MEIVSATSTTTGPRGNAGQLPDKINDIARAIQNRLGEGPFDWDVSRGDLRAISQTLVSLDDDSRNDVISRLPDSALRKWGGEIDGWMGGLDHGERTDLFNSLAQGLDAQQLARFHGALNDNLQREFGQAIQRNTDRQTQIEFLANVQQNLLQNQGTPNTEGLSPEQIELILDLSQVALDVVGLVDPTPVSDGINGIISLFRGDFLGAGISALSMIPYVGDLAKTGKLGKWAETVDGVVRMAAKDARFAEQVRPVLNKIRDGIEGIPQGAFDKLPQAAQDTLRHIASKIDELATTAGRKTDGYIATVRGQKITLDNIDIQTVHYVKRGRVEYRDLRGEFTNGIRKDFLEHLASDPDTLAALKRAGLDDSQIARIANGMVPSGWQVHHKLPLDDGGTNDFSNLVLIKNDPYHIALTNTQRSLVGDLEVGQSRQIEFPVPHGSVYPPVPPH